ncbi:L-fuculose 1-phosphate aldolase [Breoghania corrubedonensis]|uniref:L-fuculose 1-phosphate aldolase n=1 Tax=Breoghania corrubedonensis TaxID=665038 RepID=A0A2T5V1F6_9HYPH|nr:class II aldolase/adducin family protein [Breoghania corrubedonensis]PTW57593.1 L-fuculose 1-phosphate aldolase [Breoghania corrubedonensis]
MSDQSLRKAIIATCRAMNASRLNTGTSGNVSARTETGFLVTPSGIPYDDLTPEQIVGMDLDGTYEGDWLPSSEWRMHLDIYRARPEAGAIVHVHSSHAAALSCLRLDIPPFHYMIAVAGGPTLRCADYATFGTAELSRNMIAGLQGRSACLLANHGQIAFGATLTKALWLAGEVEELCHQFFLATQMAATMGKPLVILDEPEMARVMEKFTTYGKQPRDFAPGEHAAFDVSVKKV